ncbi:hypothetical protein G5714_004067 [Onychostoma macrolepis]|uniref:Ig-like domain-containing protein n=1 Tax=Onychostoma macrolepis TaxID=369639 RepID=A0A7J6DB65_9TELE|nr:hypothetical protein G5714_004067 [Onychostoma macrolepis]
MGSLAGRRPSAGEREHLCPLEMRLICLTLLIISGITDSRSEQYEVVGAAGPVFAVAGEDVILPCSVKSSISVVDMRVEWFRSDMKVNQLVHLYEDHVDRNTDQIQSYRGRTKLDHQELKRGEASLKLSSVRVSDEGLYKCFIQSRSWFDDATVNVSVEAIGRPPVITVDGFDHSGGLHLQCESEGWYPEPDLEWLNSEGVRLSSETTEKHRNTDRFSAKHTVTVYERDSKIHCRFKLKHHMLEALIITTSNMFNSWRTSVIMISVFVVLSVIAGILIAAFAHKYKGGFLELPATVGQVVGTPLIDPSLTTAPGDRLVGHCPLVEIQVNGVKVQCLVDTGSQVTLFSESLSKELFSAPCLQEAEAPWLTLRGANGLDIPYIGYLVTDLEIHGITVPQKEVVVVRDSCLGAHRALLGMNVITDCWEELFQARPIRTAPPAEKREWERIVADCRRVHTASSQGDREDVWARRVGTRRAPFGLSDYREHTNADVLSRLPEAEGWGPPLGSTDGREEGLMVGIVEAPGLQQEEAPASWGWDPQRWMEWQEGDAGLMSIRSWLAQGLRPEVAERRAQTWAVRKLLGQWEMLYLRDGVQRPDQPVYTIRPEGKPGPEQVIH